MFCLIAAFLFTRLTILYKCTELKQENNTAEKPAQDSIEIKSEADYVDEFSSGSDDVFYSLRIPLQHNNDFQPGPEAIINPDVLRSITDSVYHSDESDRESQQELDCFENRDKFINEPHMREKTDIEVFKQLLNSLINSIKDKKEVTNQDTDVFDNLFASKKNLELLIYLNGTLTEIHQAFKHIIASFFYQFCNNNSICKPEELKYIKETYNLEKPRVYYKISFEPEKQINILYNSILIWLKIAEKAGFKTHIDNFRGLVNVAKICRDTFGCEYK